MKSLFLSLVLISSMSIALEPPRPLIQKSSGGGHMHPDYVRFESCSVFAGHTDIVHSFGSQNRVVVNERRNASLTGDIGALIKQAALENLKSEPNMLCDGPSSVVKAQDVLLFSTGGCGTPKEFREGPASRRLRSIVDLYCPQTYGEQR